MGATDSLTETTITTLLDWNSQGWDIYYILNEVKPGFVGVKPRDSDMLSHEKFIIDYDKIDDTTGIMPEHLYQTMSVFTGRGVHCYIEIVGNKGEDIKTRARRIGEFLRKIPNEYPGYRVDTCTSDASRMVRLPCTINWKSEIRGLILQKPNPLICYLAGWLPPAPEPVPVPKFNGDLTNLSQVMPRLNRSAARFLLEGVSWERHKSAYSAARNLRESGVPEEAASEWVCYGASLCEPPLSEKEAKYCVWSAYKA